MVNRLENPSPANKGSGIIADWRQEDCFESGIGSCKVQASKAGWWYPSSATNTSGNKNAFLNSAHLYQKGPQFDATRVTNAWPRFEPMLAGSGFPERYPINRQRHLSSEIIREIWNRFKFFESFITCLADLNTAVFGPFWLNCNVRSNIKAHFAVMFPDTNKTSSH